MDVNLGDADAGVAISMSVISDFLGELHRIGRLPSSLTFARDIGGNPVDVTVLIDPPTFGLVQPPADDPYTRMQLTGSIEIRPAGQPGATPVTLPLDVPVLLSLVLVPADPVPEVGFRYDGTDGPPSEPLMAADVDGIFADPAVDSIVSGTRLPLAAPLVEGLNRSRTPDPAIRPPDSSWTVALTLMPGGADTVDSFSVGVGPPGTTAVPGLVESYVKPDTGLAVGYNRAFLDLMLDRGAQARIGTTVEGAEVQSLALAMSDDAIQVSDGHVKKEITILPDVDIRFEGPMIPSLVRGTTGMAFDTSGVDVDVDDSDEIFFGALQWFVTLGSAALLFTGVGSLTAIGILSWMTLVQFVWDGAVQLENAPGVIRRSLAASLGAQLSVLASSLDDDTDVGSLRIDATPDSLTVVGGNMVFFAQILVVPIASMMQVAEYSKDLRRFAIFQLQDGRRFRAQELARLMKTGKVTVPGFHQVSGDYVRSNPDDAVANNLLQSFKDNETTEVVVANHP